TRRAADLPVVRGRTPARRVLEEVVEKRRLLLLGAREQLLERARIEDLPEALQRRAPVSVLVTHAVAAVPDRPLGRKNIQAFAGCIPGVVRGDSRGHASAGRYVPSTGGDPPAGGRPRPVALRPVRVAAREAPRPGQPRAGHRAEGRRS